MKLTTIAHVSLDRVIQGLGGADEDRCGGFERGGWALPLFPADGPDAALALAEGRGTPEGLTIGIYRPAGRPRYAT